MSNYRRSALIVGILFIIGTLAGILSGLITAPMMENTEFPQNLAAAETRWILGTLLILVMGLPLAMIPAVLYPLFKKQNEILAQGAVLFRGVLEALCYLALVACMLLMLSAGKLSLARPVQQSISTLLTNATDWIELLLALVFSIGSMMISVLLFQMRLVPRWLSGWGIMGAALYFIAPFFSLFLHQHPAVGFESWIGFLIGPLAVQEMVFAVWVIIKGFNPPLLKNMP